MQLDLKKLPFGQAYSRHLLFETEEPQKGLFLGVASESSSMFAGVSARGAGLIRLTVLADGKEADWTAAADACAAQITAGARKLCFAIDGPALLLKGDVGLKMVVRLGFGETVSRTQRGIELNMGATRYVFDLRKGTADLQVGWDLAGLHSTDPEITLTPEDGVLEAVLWDVDTNYIFPEIAGDAAAAAEKAKAAFEAFRASLRGKDETYAYALWLNLQNQRGADFVLGNKVGDIRVVAKNQALAALAMGPKGAFGLVCSALGLMSATGLVPAWIKGNNTLPESAPPMWGLPLCRAFADGGIDAISKEELADGYALLDKAVGWWVKNRSLADGSFFYAYPYESGWDGVPVLPFGQGAVAPDLAAWMALNAKVLELMARKLGLAAEAENWAALAARQLEVLAGLRKNGAFVCRSVLTGEEVPCPAGISLLPLLLGDAAPDRAALAAEAEAACPKKLPFPLAGLIALESPALAGKLAELGGAVDDAPPAGAYDPLRCALLLALEERS
jgi:hypothetical protein